VIAAGIAVALTGVALAWLLLVKSLAAHGLPVRSGRRAVVGGVATVRSVPTPSGQVQIDGALWRARLPDLQEEGAPVAEASAVVVESVDGLTLTVRPAEEWVVSGARPERERTVGRERSVSGTVVRAVQRPVVVTGAVPVLARAGL
jgi:hypothetical protein